jgi:hypothetical protein
MTLGDAMDMSPPIRPASGTTIPVCESRVAPGYATLAAHVADASSSTNRLSSVRFAMDVATRVAGGSSRATVNVPTAGCSSMDKVTVSDGV